MEFNTIKEREKEENYIPEVASIQHNQEKQPKKYHPLLEEDSYLIDFSKLGVSMNDSNDSKNEDDSFILNNSELKDYNCDIYGNKYIKPKSKSLLDKVFYPLQKFPFNIAISTYFFIKNIFTCNKESEDNFINREKPNYNDNDYDYKKAMKDSEDRYKYMKSNLTREKRDLKYKNKENNNDNEDLINKTMNVFNTNNSISYSTILKDISIIAIPFVISYIAIIVSQKSINFFIDNKLASLNLLNLDNNSAVIHEFNSFRNKIDITNYIVFSFIYYTSNCINIVYDNIGSLMYKEGNKKKNMKIFFGFEIVAVIYGIISFSILMIVFILIHTAILKESNIQHSILVNISNSFFSNIEYIVYGSISSIFLVVNNMNFRFALINKEYFLSLFVIILNVFCNLFFGWIFVFNIELNSISHSISNSKINSNIYFNNWKYIQLFANLITFIISMSLILLKFSSKDTKDKSTLAYKENERITDNSMSFFNSNYYYENSSNTNTNQSFTSNIVENEKLVSLNKEFLVKLFNYSFQLFLYNIIIITSYVLYNYISWRQNIYADYSKMANILVYIFIPISSISSSVVFYISFLINRESLRGIQKVISVSFIMGFSYLMFLVISLMCGLDSYLYSYMFNDDNKINISTLNTNMNNLTINHNREYNKNTNTYISTNTLFPFLFFLISETIIAIFDSYFKVFQFNKFLITCSFLFKLLPSILLCFFCKYVSSDDKMWIIRGVCSTTCLIVYGLYYNSAFKLSTMFKRMYLVVSWEWDNILTDKKKAN